MRWGKALKAGLCALAIASGAHAATTITRPPKPEAVTDPRFEGAKPLDLTITHELFLQPVTEKLDALEEVRLERYLWTAVPMGQMIVYPDEELRPFGSVTLSEAQYRRWKYSVDSESARNYLDQIAESAFNARLPKNLRGRVPVRWRTGFADKHAEGLDRAIPFIPYLEEHARRYALPQDAWKLTIMESFFQPEAVSKAACEGPFQLSRPIARSFGLTIPTSKRGGNTTSVNESKHPLLAADAAFALLRAYAYHTGGMLTGVSAYHTGPGNLAKMRLLQLRHPEWEPTTKEGAIPTARELHLDGTDAGLFDPIMTDESPNGEESEEASTDAANGLSWIVSGGWQHPDNTKKYSKYKRDSAIYVPRFVALRNAIRREEFFVTEREITGRQLVRASDATCGPKGPFTTDQPVCWEIRTTFRETEKYLHETFTADRITVAYQKKQPRGGEPLTGESLVRIVGSAEVFAVYNPHIPRKARIPEGTDVFLPIGTGEQLYVKYAGILAPQPIRTYQDGHVTPAEPAPTILPEDRSYARLALLRSEGKYDEVTAEAVCAIADRMALLDDGSWFRTLQERTAKMDCSLTRHKTAQELEQFVGGG